MKAVKVCGVMVVLLLAGCAANQEMELVSAPAGEATSRPAAAIVSATTAQGAGNLAASATVQTEAKLLEYASEFPVGAAVVVVTAVVALAATAIILARRRGRNR